MTPTFWFLTIANTVSLTVALAALLLAVWLGPRRWTNLSFALLMSSIVMWMGGSLFARLMVNVPELGNPTPALYLLTFGFAAIGITLFWFAESFARLPRRWFRIANLLGLVAYGTFIILLLRGQVITDPRRGSDGGLDFTITPIGAALASVHYLYDAFAVFVIARMRNWREHWYLALGVALIFFTSIIALVFPANPQQTYIVPIATLLMSYELIRQQLFNPLLQLNQRLEAEVASRTAALALSVAEQERVRSELTIARNIQLSLLPRSTPRPPFLQVAGRSIPAQEVGGDFYTYHQFADGRLGVVVGDVSGKGIPAALLMAFSLRTFELLVDRHDDQGALLTACNSALAPRLGQSNMQTAFLSVVVDGRNCSASVANAGLISPLLWRDGRVAILKSEGLPLGALPETRYHERVEGLHSGDTLLLVSDGIVEAMNPERELWGFGRLEQVLAGAGAHSPDSIVDAILRAVYSHTDGAPPHDDMTVAAIQLQRAPTEHHDRATQQAAEHED
jgi:serine phosphatase RsbU (regulator of sigma subunit)